MPATSSPRYGFKTHKLKGGVFPPDHDVEVFRALGAAFPEDGLRLDPNSVWSVEEAIRVGQAIEDLNNDYFEDPTWGLEGMRRLRQLRRHSDRDQHGRGQFRAARRLHPHRGDRRDPPRHDLLGRASPGLQGGAGARDLPVWRVACIPPASSASSSPRCSISARRCPTSASPPTRTTTISPTTSSRAARCSIATARSPCPRGPASASSSTATSSPNMPSSTSELGGYTYDRDPGRPDWYCIMPERNYADPKAGAEMPAYLRTWNAPTPSS